MMIDRAEKFRKIKATYTEKKGSTKRPLSALPGSTPDEVWKSIVVDGKVHPWYSVSNKGRVASHFGNKRQNKPGFKGIDRSYDPEYCRLIRPALSYKTNHNKNKRDVYGNHLKAGEQIIQGTRVSIRLPWDFFKDINMYGSEYQYPIQGLESDMNGKCCQRTMAIHKLVAATHMSVDDFPPKRIADGYASLPENIKQWIRETVIINHINHDPTDNRVENLEYVTMRENTHKAVEQYGGHFCPDHYLKHKEPVIIEEKKPVKESTLEFLFT